jgi:hypothetical protein
VGVDHPTQKIHRTNTVDLQIRDFGTGIAPETPPSNFLSIKIYDQDWTITPLAKEVSGWVLYNLPPNHSSSRGKIRVESALGTGDVLYDYDTLHTNLQRRSCPPILCRSNPTICRTNLPASR